MEVIIAIAITSAIIGGLTTAIFMIFSSTQRGNSEVSAIRDLQNAAYSISLDTQQANATDLVEGAEPVDSLNLDWVDYNGDAHYCIYTLSGTELRRNCDGNTTTRAWYVTKMEFSISGNLLTFYVESTPPGRWGVSKNTTGEINIRPNT